MPQSASEPLLSPRSSWRTLVDAVAANAQSHPDLTVMSQWDGQHFSHSLTTAELHQQIRAVAAGLVASGIRPGDRVAIMSRTRFEWTILDFAIWHAGAITVPIYETSSADQVRWILTDAKVLAVIVENRVLADLVTSVRADVPALSNMWIIDDGALADISSSGADHAIDIDATLATRSPADAATIIYTSGTTGRPKGCVLTHKNMIFEVQSVLEAEPEAVNPDTTSVLFLPLAHVFARVLQAVLVCTRAHIGYCGDASALTQAMQEMRPNLIVAVPRVFEKLINTASQRAAQSGKQKLFERAVDTAQTFSRSMDSGRISISTRIKHAVFDRLVYQKLRTTLGGNLTWAVSGGAPLGERLGHAFRGMGITVLEGYGLTETTAGTSINRPNKSAGTSSLVGLRIGTVGRPIPGSSIRIDESGEVQLLGDNIFLEYWNNPEATANSFTTDGWFRTGDLGSIDENGFLRITGRAKELIVTAGGKNVAPAVLEDPINASFLVSMSMVVGDTKPFVAALVTLDADAVKLWLRSRGRDERTSIADLVNDADIRAEVQRVIDQSNAQVSKAEQIRSFAIVPQEWTLAGGQITPSLKLKRSVVMAQHEADIENLYRGGK